MFNRRLPARRVCVIGLLAMASAFAVTAQTPQEKEMPAKGAGEVTLSADLVKTGLYVIRGGGGNTLMRFSASGLILVDGKLPGNYRPLTSQVRKINKIGDLPTRVLILTNHHENHTGNNAQFAAAGIPLLVQENAKPLLPAIALAGGKPLPPTVTYDREYKLRLGGVEVGLFHFGNANTNNDTVVHFADLKVVAVGDLFAPDGPAPDFAGGGSLVNWGPVLAQILKLDFDVVVPSNGPMVSRADLEAYKTRVDTLVSRATGLVKKGVPKDELMSQLKTDDLGWRFNLTNDQLDRFYAELSQSK